MTPTYNAEMARSVKVGKCKHCDRDVFVSAAVIFRLSGKLAIKARKSTATAPERIYSCRWCGNPCNATFRRLHEPRCPYKPSDAGSEQRGRPVNTVANKRYLEMARRNPNFTVEPDGTVRPKKRRI